MNWNKIFQGNVGYKFWFQRQNFILGQPVNLVTHAPTVKNNLCLSTGFRKPLKLLLKVEHIKERGSSMGLHTKGLDFKIV